MDPSSSQMKGFQKFATLEEGISAMARNLYKTILAWGLQRLKQLAPNMHHQVPQMIHMVRMGCGPYW